MPTFTLRRTIGPAARLSRRAGRAAVLVLAAAAAAACGDDDDPTGDDEPEIQAVRLTVTPAGGQPATYTVTSGATTAPTIQLRVGTAAVTGQALDANGQAIALDEPFELRLVATVTGGAAAEQTPLSGALTFAAGGALAGTLTATAATTVSGFVRMVHLEEAHSDFDARVNIAVTP